MGGLGVDQDLCDERGMTVHDFTRCKCSFEMMLKLFMEAFSFCCHVYGVSEFFGLNRPFRIIWCVFSSILKNTLPLCLEDGLSMSRNGICAGSGG